MNSMRTLLVSVLVLSFGRINGAPLVAKKLAGPPTEFIMHSLPEPTQGTITSQSALVAVHLDERGIWNDVLPADSDTLITLTVLSPATDLEVYLLDPTGKKVPLASLLVPSTFPIGGIELPASTYVIENPMVGMYKIAITGNPSRVASSESDAYIIWFNQANDEDDQSAVVLHSHLRSYDLRLGEEVGLVSYLSDVVSSNSSTGGLHRFSQSKSMRLHSPDVIVVDAEMSVIMPDGSEIHRHMHEDAISAKGDRMDGIFEASIVARQAGQYILQSTIKGKTSSGRPFIRSTQHLIAVVDSHVSFTLEASGHVDSTSNRLLVDVGVASTNAQEYKAYAEVWVVHSQDVTPAPVCWVGGVLQSTPSPDNMNSFVQLEIDLDWFKLANIAPVDIVLRNVRLQDLDTSIPLVTLGELRVSIASDVQDSVLRVFQTSPRVQSITERMTSGVRPAFLSDPVPSVTGPTLALLHGYCAANNPWAVSDNAGDFTVAGYFSNLKASISHDAFARLVNTWSSGANMVKFSAIGHSQGGPALVTLFNFYWSGLDQVSPTAGRLIQSVGSPYMGCSAAGTAANIGKLFGVGCGANTDLTTDGASNWLSLITSTARARVYYYTTTYQLGTLFGDWCNLPINAILSWPNDGTTELDKTTLTEASNQGSVQKWCHVDGMAYPAHTTDHSRNRLMNSYAARV